MAGQIKVELEKQLYSKIYSLFQRKFCDADNHRLYEKEIFYDLVMGELHAHEDSAEDNKNKYFAKNKELSEKAVYGSMHEHLQKHMSELKKIFKFVMPIVILIATIIAGFFCIKQSELILFSGCAAILIVSLYVIVFYKSAYDEYKLKKELKLKKYGETWVRHRVTFESLNREIISYVYDLGEYGKLLEEETKRCYFQQRFLEISKENMDKFESNMKNLEEFVKVKDEE